MRQVSDAPELVVFGTGKFLKILKLEHPCFRILPQSGFSFIFLDHRCGWERPGTGVQYKVISHASGAWLVLTSRVRRQSRLCRCGAAGGTGKRNPKGPTGPSALSDVRKGLSRLGHLSCGEQSGENSE